MKATTRIADCISNSFDEAEQLILAFLCACPAVSCSSDRQLREEPQRKNVLDSVSARLAQLMSRYKAAYGSHAGPALL